MTESVSSECCIEKLTCELPSEDENFISFTSDLNTSVLMKDLASSSESLKHLNFKTALSANEETVVDNADDKSNLSGTDESLGILPDLLKDLTSDLDLLSFDMVDKEKISIPVAPSTVFFTEFNLRDDEVVVNAAPDTFCFKSNPKHPASDFDSPTWSDDGVSIYASTPKHELANDLFEGTICGSPSLDNSNSMPNKKNGKGTAEPPIDLNSTVVYPLKNKNLETIPLSERETDLKENQLLNLNETQNLSLGRTEDEIKYSDWISELQLKYSDTLNLNKTQTLKSNPEDSSNSIAVNAMQDKLPIQASNTKENMQNESEGLCVLDSTKIMPQALNNTFVKIGNLAPKKNSLIGNKKTFNLKQISKTPQSKLLEPMNLNKTVKKSVSLPPENKDLQIPGHRFQKTSSKAHVLNSSQCLTAGKLKERDVTYLKNDSKNNLRRLSLSGVENKTKKGVNLNSTMTLSSTTGALNSKNLGGTISSLKAFASNSSGRKTPNTLTVKPSAALNSTVCISSKRSSFGKSNKCLPLSVTTEHKNPTTGGCKEKFNSANGRMKFANERDNKNLQVPLSTEMNFSATLMKPETFEAACNSTFSADELKSLVTADSSKAWKKRNSTPGLKPRSSVEKSISSPAVKKDVLNKSITNNNIGDLQNKQTNSLSKRKSFNVPIIRLKNKDVDKKTDNCIDSSKKASLHPKDALSRCSQRKSFSNNKMKTQNPEALGMKPSNTSPVAKAAELIQDATFISEANNLEKPGAVNSKSANGIGNNATTNNVNGELNDLHKTGAIPKILKFRSSRPGKMVSSIPGPSRGLPKLSTNLDGIKKIGHVISGKLKSPSKFKKKPLQKM